MKAKAKSNAKKTKPAAKASDASKLAHKFFSACLCKMVEENTSFLRAVDIVRAKDPRCPSRTTFYTMMAKDKSLHEKYFSFKCMTTEMHVDEMLDIADHAKEDAIEVNGQIVMCKEFVARSRVRIDTRKWVAGKIMPHRYGDSADLKIAEMQEQINQLKKVLNVV